MSADSLVIWSRFALLVLASFMQLPAIACTYWGPQKTEFEVGVIYNAPIDYIGQFVLVAASDDCKFNVEWGDGAVERVAFVNVPFPYPAGTWQMRATGNHSYAAVGAKTLSLVRLAGQYVGGGQFPEERRSYHANIYARNTIHAIDRNSAYPARSGRRSEFNVVLDNPAPPSGTRVYLTVPVGSPVIDPTEPVPLFIDVPPGSLSATFNVRFKWVVPAPTNVTITAQAGSPQSVLFVVTP